jgi:hypothetical protein
MEGFGCELRNELGPDQLYPYDGVPPVTTDEREIVVPEQYDGV